MEQGTTVRFTASRLGLVADIHQRGFEPEVANKGDEGTYVGPHPTLHEDGWHVIQVGELYCPCHESQFEVSS